VSHLSVGCFIPKQLFKAIPVNASDSLFQTTLWHKEGAALSEAATKINCKKNLGMVEKSYPRRAAE
jgi:hypothetical protein